MAPLNPHSTPYLSLRSGTNGFYYRRQIPEGQRARLSGDLQLHDGRIYPLSGQAALKISLGTSDVRIAERRMRSINGDVQRLLDGPGPVPARPTVAGAVASLADKQIRLLAEQHHYRLLADDDLVQLDPENDPEVVIEYLRLSGEDVAAPDFDARRAIDLFVEINLEVARSNVRSGNWQTFLTGIEGEDDDGTTMVVLSVVDDLLQRNGLALSEDSIDWKRLALAVMRADAREKIALRWGGRSIETPPRPELLLQRRETAGSLPLSGLVERWVSERKPAAKTELDVRSVARRFCEVCGDLPVRSIGREHVRDFKDALLIFPARPPGNVRHRSVSEQVAWAAAHPEHPKLSSKTINDKMLGILSALFGFGVRNAFMDANPRSGVVVAVPAVEADGRVVYGTEDLRLIFDLPIFGLPPRRPKGGGGEAARWLPLIALFSGARLEEIGQLRTEDVKISDGIRFLDMRVVETGEAGTKRKTRSSRRVVPVHDFLVACGFMAYVSERRSDGSIRLFPELRSKRSEVTAAWSQWWGRYIRAHGISDRRKVFHSFRHTAKDAFRDCGVEEPVSRALMGHVGQGEAAKYGHGYSLRRLNCEMQKLSYPDLDLDHLLPTALAKR